MVSPKLIQKNGSLVTIPLVLLLLSIVLPCEARGIPSSKTPKSFRLNPLEMKINTKSKSTTFTADFIPRGGDMEVTTTSTESISATPINALSTEVNPYPLIVYAVDSLRKYMQGPKTDTLILLLTTALNTPLCQRLKTSPILGFLILGTIMGPQGKNMISNIHTTEMLADIGIVFFLFEMGIHLNFETLMDLRTMVFGLGLSQVIITGTVIGLISSYIGGLSRAASIVVGGGLALSSSAFVLQLLKDKDQLSSQFGKSSFGILLLQDLAVVPLMTITPILAGNGQGLGKALGSASIQTLIALATIGFFGKFLLNPFFEFVSNSQSQEAFVGAILSVVMGMSFLTEGLGLSNTLGAFLAGILLSDTKFKPQVETEIAPFRGILVGLFFFTVGFEIDLNLIMSNMGLVSSVVLGIIFVKAFITTALCRLFGLEISTAQRTGLILSQGGEFAIVAFRLARSLGILDESTTKLLLTSISLTMAATPFLEELGEVVAKKIGKW